ncbi:MAG: calcium/sodium antiporter [Clostridia bacterium]|nr:calcium/sodium antiporter [Clostridia bacterium]
MLIVNFILLIIGLFLLIKGADVFVDGASNIARKLKIPSLIIGLTLVSIGTSAPELSISVTSALQGMNSMSFGNVIGSNTFNVLVVIGVSALFTALTVSSDVKKFDVPILIGIYVLLALFAFVISPLALTRIEAAILLVLFVLYIALLIFRGRSEQTEDDSDEPIKKWYVSIILIVVGIAAIIFGGDLVVDSASAIAIKFGMSELMVGLTIVAVGTSLPELVTSVVAARKGELDIAVGNAVGSSIMNILLILGVSAVLRPISIEPSALVDVIVMALSILIIFFTTLKKNSVGKITGVSMLAVYVLYIAYIILRNIGLI